MVIWEDGTLTQDAYVTVNDTDYTVNMPEYEGSTPITADNLNLMQQVDTAYGTIVADTTLTNGYEVTLPLFYQVGNNSLELYLNGSMLIAKTDDNDDGHYVEVGDEGEKSNTIQFYRTSSDGSYTLTEDVTLKVVVHGVTQE